MPNRQISTLLQINRAIKRAIDTATRNRSFWIRTEITSFKFHQRSGHYYLELAHTEQGKTIAKARAQIWRDTAQSIKRQLGTDFENILKQGSEVLIFCKIRFDQIYGYSIIIEDVDKEFALGMIEAQKKECLEKLRKEGILNLNKQIPVPSVIQHIIVLGSVGTAGIADFQKQILENKFRYAFDVKIVNIQVQGDAAKKGIVKALTKTATIVGNVLIVILRGGGSKLDLHIFNDYDICKLITQHKVPVFTAIGHETDQSVCDLVANTPHKTPSAVGAYIVEHNMRFEAKQQTKWIKLKDISLRYYKNQHNWIAANSEGFETKVISYTRLRRGTLHQKGNRLLRSAKHEISSSSESVQLRIQSIFNFAKSNLSDIEPSRLNNSFTILKGESRRVLDIIHQHNRNRPIEKISTLSENLIAKERRKIVGQNALVEFASPLKLSDRGFGIISHGEQILRKTDNLIEGNRLSIVAYGKKFEVKFNNYK